jgi:4-diphosphocytidyl-2-C-methyl-D-erythritol kinase
MVWDIRFARHEEILHLREIEDAAGELFSGSGLIDESRDESLPVEKVARLIDLKQVWVCSSGAASPVGFVIVSTWDTAVYIEEIDVLPTYGRQGLGTRLLSHVCAWARDHGFRCVVLSTFVDVPWNAPFYRKNGFSELHRSEWSAQMKSIRIDEAKRGLNVAKRVFMRRKIV